MSQIRVQEITTAKTVNHIIDNKLHPICSIEFLCDAFMQLELNYDHGRANLMNEEFEAREIHDNFLRGGHEQD